jgi:hypothetical protein
MRDVANMGFIFLLLYTAIGTVFQLSKVDYKRMLPKIIIIALLINFSGFFTKTAIDISNVLAYELYSQLGSKDGDEIISWGFGGRFVSAMRLSGEQISPDDEINNTTTRPGASLGVLGTIAAAIGNNLRLLVSSWVLFALAIMMFIRAIVLLLLYILAPLAMFSLAMPIYNKWDDWLGRLSKQLIFAPAVLLMLGLVLLMSEGDSVANLAKAATEATKNEAGKNSAGVLGVLLLFVIVNGLTVASLIIANVIGATGAKFAAEMGAKANAGLVSKGIGVGKWVGKKAAPRVSAGARRLDSYIAGSRAGGAYTSGRGYAALGGGYVASAAKWAKQKTPTGVKEVLAHPLATMNEQVARYSQGLGGPLGNTREEKGKAKKAAEEAAKEEKAAKIKLVGDKLKTMSTMTDVVIQAELGALTDEEISKLDPSVISLPHVARNILPSGWTEIFKSTKGLTTTQKTSIVDAVTGTTAAGRATVPPVPLAHPAGTSAAASWAYMSLPNIKHFFNIP